jgi:spermidine/putrescine transport system substrate-binding protein
MIAGTRAARTHGSTASSDDGGPDRTMRHPREQLSPGRTIDRRDFLRRSAGAAIALPSLAAILAACQSRTETDGGGGGLTEVSLPRPNNPVALPTFDDNPPIDDGLSPEAGPLRIYNWNDYVWKKVLKRFEEEAGVEIEYTQFTGMSEAISKIQNGAIEFDLFFPTIEHLRTLALAKAIQPLNKSYLPNYTANAWPRLQDPWYDQGGVYATPYLTFKDGVGFRRDMVDPEPSGDPAAAFDIFWDPKYEGQVLLLSEYRETMAMSLLRNGASDVNTDDATEIQAAGDAILELINENGGELTSPTLSDYQALPEGTKALSFSWSGNMNYARYYLPKETPSDVMGFYYPPGSLALNDLIVVSSTATNPVLAHMFINFMYDRTNALDNFSYEGYQPPLMGVELDEWLERGVIPENLQTTIVNESDFETGQQIAPLEVAVDQLYQDAWASITAGAETTE